MYRLPPYIAVDQRRVGGYYCVQSIIKKDNDTDDGDADNVNDFC